MSHAYCVFPRLDLEEYLTKEDYRKSRKELIAEGVGGFCVFGKVSLDHARRAINELRSETDRDLIFSADFENGLPMRLIEGTEFPHAMALGKTGDHQKTFIASQIIGKESHQIGVNWIFGPVVDINSNKKNPIINIRSFGEDPETVGVHAAAYIKGLEESGIMSCAKHFPGHGDTDTDSHISLPILNFDKKRLEEFEFKPFVKSIKNGVQSIMIGHLAVPSIDSSNMPASLSEKVIDVLKNELNFDGIIISDALDMNSIKDTYSSADAAEKAVRAGNHIALMPEDPREAIQRFKELSESDNEFAELLKSNEDIIKEKFEWVFDNKIKIETGDLKKLFMEHEKISLTIARSAVELEIKESLTPIEYGKQVASFTFLQHGVDLPKATMFYNLLQQAIENDIDFAYIDENISQHDLMGMKEGTVDADIFIFAYFYRSKAWNSDLGDLDKIEAIKEYLAHGKKIINIFFGNPYLSEGMKGQMNIKTFSSSLSSLASAVMVLSGKELIE